MRASDRFADDLARLTQPDVRIGLAVSGGPDSLALLLLAHSVAPDRIAAATVDHGFRAEAKDEAAMVANLCAERGIPHRTLVAEWPDGTPRSNVQAAARKKRYSLLGKWAQAEGIAVIATAHHRDDAVETFLMRALRGAGVTGLAAMTETRKLTDRVRLIRPLLDWSRDELADLVAIENIAAVDDPSNHDPAHDRARLRSALVQAELGEISRIADSASHLREVERSLEWVAGQLAAAKLDADEDSIALDHADIPDELLRRLLLIALDRLGDRAPRGPDLERAMTTLKAGGQCVLGQTLLQSDGERWTLSPAPPRNS